MPVEAGASVRKLKRRQRAALESQKGGGGLLTPAPRGPDAYDPGGAAAAAPDFPTPSSVSDNGTTSPQLHTAFGAPELVAHGQRDVHPQNPPEELGTVHII